MKNTIAQLLCLSLSIAAWPAFAAKVPALIIDGQNNHDWKATTPVLQRLLEETGLFTVEVATAPPAQDAKLADFQPDFAKYRVIVMNYTKRG